MAGKSGRTDARLAGIKAQSIVFIYESVFRDHIYKNRDMEQFYEQIREMVPQEGEFFIRWFKGFVFVARHDFDSARKMYMEALDVAAVESAESDGAHVNPAGGDYTPTFLQQGFALFMYDGMASDAQKFWNFGVRCGFFAEDSEKFFSQFEAREQFWVQFGPDVFVDSERAEKDAIADYRKSFDSDLEGARSCLSSLDVNEFRIKGVSPLYYAVQIKGIISGGLWKYVDDIVDMRTEQLFSSVDVSRISREQQMQHYMTIKHQMKLTYEKSGLASIMFRAQYCEESQIDEKVRGLEEIISILVQKTDDVDAYVKQIEGKMGTDALHLAAEIDDVFTCRALLEKGSDVDRKIGSANFGMKYEGGKSVKTEIPNTFIYRLISFKSWNVLRMYLTDFASLAKKSMTEKSDKYNITPLVFLILNTVYSSENETQYEENRKTVDEMIPLFMGAGAILDENTAFGTAKKLLGL